MFRSFETRWGQRDKYINWRVQMNTWNIIYLNCWERYEFVIDHRSCEIKAWKKFRPECFNFTTAKACITAMINHKFINSPQFKWMIFHAFICILHLPWELHELTMWLARGWLDSSVQRRKWSPDKKWSPNCTANDPEPQMIPDLDHKWSSRKMGMAQSLVFWIF